MSSDKKSETLPSDFINNIQKNAKEVRRVAKKKTMVKRPADDWSKIKTNIDKLKIKCADFSKKSKEAKSEEERTELARKAQEIREELNEIKSKMDKKQ